MFFALYIIFLGPGISLGLWLGYVSSHFSIDARGILGGMVSMPIGLLSAISESLEIGLLSGTLRSFLRYYFP